MFPPVLPLPFSPTHLDTQREMKGEAIIVLFSRVTRETMMELQVENSIWVENMSIIANIFELTGLR